MWERYAEGRDVGHWKRIHDQVNGLVMMPAPVAASAPDPWLPLIRDCDYHNPGCCAHPAAFCSLFARDVSREDCVGCLTGRGIVP
jgi:hypothetical protein